MGVTSIGWRRELSASAESYKDELPHWWVSTLSRITDILALPENWDSYGAAKPDPQLAYHAVDLLQQIAQPDMPQPSIVPTVQGGVQFEWHTRGIDLEVEILSPIEINVYYYDASNDDEWEDRLDYNLTSLSEKVRELLTRERQAHLAA